MTPLPSLITRTGRRLSRREAAAIVQRMTAQANGRLSDEEKIEVSPHVLRHTFLRKLAETKGVHYAREASGHQSDRYIWRYVKPDQQTLADPAPEGAGCTPHAGRISQPPLATPRRRTPPTELEELGG